MKHLWERYADFLPLNPTPIIRASLEEYEGYFGAADPHPVIKIIWPAVEFGFPFACLRGKSAYQPLKRKIERGLKNKASIDPSAYAEVDAAALLVVPGANDVEYVPTTNHPTQDLRSTWQTEVVQIEVVKATEKPAHAARRARIMQLLEKIRALNRMSRVTIHVSDTFDSKNEDDLVAAVASMKPDSPVELDGVWSASTHSTPPAWWPKNAVRITACSYGSEAVIASGLPSSEVELSPASELTIHFPVSITGYINPAERKATKFQGSRDYPFLIAVDVTEIPESGQTFANALPSYFSLPDWLRVSGVLLFTRMGFCSKAIGWYRMLIVNPHASHGVPQAVLSKFPNAERPMEVSLPTSLDATA